MGQAKLKGVLITLVSKWKWGTQEHRLRTSMGCKTRMGYQPPGGYRTQRVTKSTGARCRDPFDRSPHTSDPFSLAQLSWAFR